MNNKKVFDLISERKSVRTYEDKPLSDKDKKTMTDFISANLDNPFYNKIEIIITEEDEKIVPSYGFIKGARSYMAGKTLNTKDGLLAYGYVFEKMILYCMSIGISTCWLGGSFKKNILSKKLRLKTDEIIPAVSPVGYAKEKRSMRDKAVRALAKSHKRKAFNELFYDKVDDNPVFKDAFEALRLAPSAANKQPWVVITDDETVHFYKKKNELKKDGFDIQLVDMGIAFCHFDLVMKEKGFEGKWMKLNKADEKDIEYIIGYG